MRPTRRAVRAAAAWLLLASLATARPAVAQSLLLDQPLRAGDLTLFPDLNDANAYFYVVDRPRLARDAQGRPQFSFLRYVENVRSGGERPEAREGVGGGIVQALVTLSVSPAQVAAAERELQRTRPGARLAGPAVFKAGRVGLVSSFTDAKGGFSTQVVGIGAAPLLDGEKAAVSIQLTAQGSKLLWESFQTASPDVTFRFEMDLSGYRAPARASIRADFDQIHRHQAFSAAAATRLFAGEIRFAFDDLRRTDAIRITQVGTDARMEAILATAYQKLTEMMFTPAPPQAGTAPTPAGAAAAPSLLERASAMLAQERARVSADNAAIRADHTAERERARQTDAAVRAARAAAPTPARDTLAGGASRESEGERRARAREARAARQGDDLWGSPLAPEAPLRTEAVATAEREADLAAESAPPSAEPPRLREEAALPSVAVLAAYELRSVRRSGTFEFDLDKYTADHLTLRFDENIGDLRSLTADPAHFRQVNLDDPLHRQRELAVFVDGLDARDFGEYVNSATVRLRKQHAGGALSTDEVRIDRFRFNQQGNQFRLMYGWKGDTDSRQWMDYEVQTAWSFFGGAEVTQPWTKSRTGAIALSAPYQRRTVEVQADAESLTTAGVRSVTVRLHYRLGALEQSRSATLDVARRQLSERIEFMLPAGTQEYEYEVVWQLRGNRTVSSGRKRGDSAILFVDEVAGG